MKVLDLIGARAEVFSIRAGATVHEAAQYLRDRQVRAVGVLDENGTLVGVLSQSDISDKVAAENKCPAWMRVGEIMSTALVVVTPERPLLVIDHDGGFRGMLSVSDLLKVIASDEKARADMLEAFVFDRPTA